MINRLVIEQMNIGDINVSHYNPREDLQPGHPMYEKLKTSILTYGYIDPLIYNKRTKRLVGGHQRLKVLKELGETTVDVSVVDVSEHDEKDLNIRLNKITGEFDQTKLFQVIDELQQENYNITDLGFDETEFDNLVAEMQAENDAMDAMLDGTDVNDVQTSVDAGLDQNQVDNNERDLDTNYTNEEHQVVPYDVEDDDEDEDEDIIKLTYPVRTHERDIIVRAIEKAKRKYGCHTSTEAIIKICDLFSNR